MENTAAADPFAAELEELRRHGLLRKLREVRPTTEQPLMLSERGLINWGSNDYLGLTRHPRIIEAAREAIGLHGVGSGASRLVTGSHAPHFQLEEKLAAFKGKPAALTFASGYATATGVLPALCSKEDVIILDKLTHACLIDGARLSGATLRVFPHNHVGKLESLLHWAVHQRKARRIVVVTESIFSMDGDRAPLAEIVALKTVHPFLLLVDEAHAVGVVGPQGQGLVHEAGLTDQVDLLMGTLSKAFGLSGGYLAAHRTIIDLLTNRARSFVFSTAPPPAIAAAAIEALDLIAGEDGARLRQRLWSTIHLLKQHVPPDLQSPAWGLSAILPVILGRTARALAASKLLAEHHCHAPAIRFPTVPRHAARLRITATALHTPAHIADLVAALQRLLDAPDENVGIPPA